MKLYRTRGGDEREWSLPVRGAWIEIVPAEVVQNLQMSLPVRGAWIEIAIKLVGIINAFVAPCEGSVD